MDDWREVPKAEYDHRERHAEEHYRNQATESCSLFLVPVGPPVRFEGGENCVFFGRAIFDQFWSSTAPALRFLAVSRFFGAHPPARPFR